MSKLTLKQGQNMSRKALHCYKRSVAHAAKKRHSTHIYQINDLQSEVAHAKTVQCSQEYLQDK